MNGRPRPELRYATICHVSGWENGYEKRSAPFLIRGGSPEIPLPTRRRQPVGRLALIGGMGQQVHKSHQELHHGGQTLGWMRRTCVTAKEKADVTEHPQGFDHVGLLVNEPPGPAELPFI